MSTATEMSSLVTFQLEEDIYGIDIMRTSEIIKYTKLRRVPNSPYFFEGMLNMRGQVIPVINFKKLFRFDTYDLSKEKGIIIINIRNITFGVIIDKIMRVMNLENLAITPIQGISKEIEKYVVGIIQHEEELVSVLDMDSIVGLIDTGGVLSNVDEYLLKYKKEKLAESSQQIDKALQKFLAKLQFPFNDATRRGVRKYFYKLCLRHDMPPSQALQYLQKVLTGSELYHNLLPDGTRYFYDSNDDYNCLRNILFDVIIPHKQNSGNKNITIWNLGDPSGTEAYSLAILIENFLPLGEIWDIKIICSGDDINQLEHGKEGKFKPNIVARVGNQDRTEFFNHHKEENLYEIKEEFKEKVVFDLRSAANDEKMSGIDLILARNYLSKLNLENINKNLQIFFKALNPNGILMLSEVEEIDDLAVEFSSREINNRKYYVKETKK